MALEERERLELRQGLVEVLGPTNGSRLMDQVPPFDWSDVAMKSDVKALETAMKSDLVALEERLELKLDAKLGQFTRTLFLALIGLMLTQSSITIAAFTLAR